MIEHCDLDIWADGGHHTVCIRGRFGDNILLGMKCTVAIPGYLCRLVFGRFSTTATSSLRGCS